MNPVAARTKKIAALPTPEALAQACAAKFAETAREAIGLRGKFSVALSGGNTPALLFRELAAPRDGQTVDWQRVHLYWSDERAVPLESAASNFALVQRELIARIAIPTENIHRIPGELGDLPQAAQAYEALIRRNISLNSRGIPRFDLVMLGLGTDGHTASLFPNADELREARKLVVATAAAVAGFRRITMTLPLINAARQAWFLVTGRDKSAILKSVIQEQGIKFPAQRVRPSDGELIFWADKEAVAGLAQQKANSK